MFAVAQHEAEGGDRSDTSCAKEYGAPERIRGAIADHVFNSLACVLHRFSGLRLARLTRDIGGLFGHLMLRAARCAFRAALSLVCSSSRSAIPGGGAGRMTGAGYGLQILESIVQDVSIDANENGTTVRLTQPIGGS